MNKFYETLMVGVIPVFLGVSLYAYITGDAVLHVMSYQGPIVAGGILGWLSVMRANKDRVYSPSVTEELMPIIGLVFRKYTPLLITAGVVIMSIWLVPNFYRLEIYNPIYYVASFISEIVGGFLVGVTIPSLRFIEKVILYSLGVGADLFYVYIIYIGSTMFGISQSVMLNYVLATVFLVKAPEGIALSLYIARKIGML